MVDRLAGKSLVTAEPGEDGTRYRLLETVRQYAAGRLAETGDAEAAKRRHALAFLNLAGRKRRVGVLSPDSDNFRAALEWALAAGDQAGPRLALALGEILAGPGAAGRAPVGPRMRPRSARTSSPPSTRIPTGSASSCTP